MTDATISGRPLFAIAGTVVVLIAGGFGALVGATGQERDASADLLGVVSFEMTPLSMAAFGVVATSLILLVLFGLVRVASQYDTTTEESG